MSDDTKTPVGLLICNFGKWWRHVKTRWKSFSSPEAALLLVSTKNRDLWPCPTPEVRNSRTSRHSAHVQSQVWQIWLVLVSIYCVFKAIQKRNVVGPGQRSRFLVLTKRSAASGNENGWKSTTQWTFKCLETRLLNNALPLSRGGGVLGSIFAGYVPLASQNPYPIIVYSLANYWPHLSHFWANVVFAIPT